MMGVDGYDPLDSYTGECPWGRSKPRKVWRRRESRSAPFVRLVAELESNGVEVIIARKLMSEGHGQFATKIGPSNLVWENDRNVLRAVYDCYYSTGIMVLHEEMMDAGGRRLCDHSTGLCWMIMLRKFRCAVPYEFKPYLCLKVSYLWQLMPRNLRSVARLVPTGPGLYHYEKGKGLSLTQLMEGLHGEGLVGATGTAVIGGPIEYSANEEMFKEMLLELQVNKYSADRNNPLIHDLSTLAQQAVIGLDQKQKGKEQLSIPFKMEQESKLFLIKNFPEFNLRFLDRVYSDHPVAAGMRLCFSTLFDIKLKGSEYVDIGGDPAFHVSRATSCIHVCNPEVDVRDSKRFTERLLWFTNSGHFRDSDMVNSSRKLTYLTKLEKIVGEFACCKLAQDCDLSCDRGVMVEVYDMTLSELCDTMFKRNIQKVDCCLYLPAELLENSGTVDDREAGIRCVHDDLTVEYKMGSNDSEHYIHSKNTLREWLSVSFIESGGKLYRKTQESRRGGWSWFSVVEATPRHSGVLRTSMTYTRVNRDLYELRIPRFADDDSTIVRWEKKRLPKDYVDKVMSYLMNTCSLINDRTMDYSISYSRLQSTAMTLAGKVVRQSVGVGALELADIVTVLLVESVRRREGALNSAKLLLAYTRHAGVFKGMLRLLFFALGIPRRMLNSLAFTLCKKILTKDMISLMFGETELVVSIENDITVSSSIHVCVSETRDNYSEMKVALSDFISKEKAFINESLNEKWTSHISKADKPGLRGGSDDDLNLSATVIDFIRRSPKSLVEVLTSYDERVGLSGGAKLLWNVINHMVGLGEYAVRVLLVPINKVRTALNITIELLVRGWNKCFEWIASMAKRFWTTITSNLARLNVSFEKATSVVKAAYSRRNEYLEELTDGLANLLSIELANAARDIFSPTTVSVIGDLVIRSRFIISGPQRICQVFLRRFFIYMLTRKFGLNQSLARALGNMTYVFLGLSQGGSLYVAFILMSGVLQRVFSLYINKWLSRIGVSVEESVFNLTVLPNKLALVKALTQPVGNKLVNTIRYSCVCVFVAALLVNNGLIGIFMVLILLMLVMKTDSAVIELSRTYHEVLCEMIDNSRTRLVEKNDASTFEPMIVGTSTMRVPTSRPAREVSKNFSPENSTVSELERILLRAVKAHEESVATAGETQLKRSEKKTPEIVELGEGSSGAEINAEEEQRPESSSNEDRQITESVEKLVIPTTDNPLQLLKTAHNSRNCRCGKFSKAVTALLEFEVVGPRLETKGGEVENAIQEYSLICVEEVRHMLGSLRELWNVMMTHTGDTEMVKSRFNKSNFFFRWDGESEFSSTKTQDTRRERLSEFECVYSGRTHCLLRAEQVDGLEPLVTCESLRAFYSDRKLLGIQETKALERFEVDRFVIMPPGGGKTTKIVKESLRFHQSGKGRSGSSPMNITIMCATRAGRLELEKKIREQFNILKSGLRPIVKTYSSVVMEPNPSKCDKVMLDEAFMAPFGEIMVCLSKIRPTVVEVFGDPNQIPYICRVPFMNPMYSAIPYDKEYVECSNYSYRCPADVSWYLTTLKDNTGSPAYPGGVVSYTGRMRSVSIMAITSVNDVPLEKDTDYLTFTQMESSELMTSLRMRSTENGAPRVLTVHEAQGMTFANVILMRSRMYDDPVYESKAHVLVGVSRHTHSFKYATLSSKLSDPLAKAIEQMKSVSDLVLKDHLVRRDV